LEFVEERAVLLEIGFVESKIIDRHVISVLPSKFCEEWVRVRLARDEREVMIEDLADNRRPQDHPIASSCPLLTLLLLLLLLLLPSTSTRLSHQTKTERTEAGRNTDLLLGLLCLSHGSC
jgi:hypothetical protein